MEVIILDSPKEVAESAAAIVDGFIREKPDAVLGLATGSTPMALYEQLIERHQNQGLSFSQVTSFNLDEYLGLEEDHTNSYRHFMNSQFFDHIDIDRANTHLPMGISGRDPREVGPAYEDKITAHGGIDLQVLGIGSNGHIGFNESTSSLGSRTRVKTLSRQTIEDNSRLFHSSELQPHLAVTMGIATIMEADRVMLLATGVGKADAIRATVEGPICSMNPASVLQQHQRVRLIVDEAAASKLELGEYYRWVLQQSESIAAAHGDSAGGDPWLI